MKQFILKIPENVELSELSEEVQASIEAVNGAFPAGVVVNSTTINGYELKLVQAESDSVQISGLISALSLDWEVLAESGEYSDSDLILPYMLDNVLIDEEGDEYDVETFNIEALQTYAGMSWLWV